MHQYKLEELVNHSDRSFQYEKLSSVLDLLPKLNLQEGPWLAGGAVRRLIAGENLDSDFDVFFSNEVQLEFWQQKLEIDHWVKLRETAHNITYQKDNVIVQLINIRYFESPQDVIDWFDYTICQAITDGTTLIVGEYTLWDIARKRLVLNNVHYAVSTMRRMLKYANQGYTACAGTMATLLDKVVNDPTIINQEIEYVD